MRPDHVIGCRELDCFDVKHQSHIMPGIDVDPKTVSVVMISEAAPVDPDDYYYAHEQPSFQQTTVQAFLDSGLNVTSIQDILNLGVYLTTAVKCAKTAYQLKPGTIEKCSCILEKELALFPNTRVLLLMGDIAIKSLNLIAKRARQARIIPAGPTYKLRNREYSWGECRVFPSYLQAGPKFLIEKSKRRMIAEDIRRGMESLRQDQGDII